VAQSPRDLVLRVAESVDADHDTDAEDFWAAEADRIEALAAGTTDTITTTESLAKARTRRPRPVAPRYAPYVTALVPLFGCVGSFW